MQSFPAEADEAQIGYHLPEDEIGDGTVGQSTGAIQVGPVQAEFSAADVPQHSSQVICLDGKKDSC